MFVIFFFDVFFFLAKISPLNFIILCRIFSFLSSQFVNDFQIHFERLTLSMWEPSILASMHLH